MPQITVHMRNTAGETQEVQLSIDTGTAQGTLLITALPAGATQQRALTEVRKRTDGKGLTCKVSIATVTITLDDTPTPPTLHLEARAFFPILEATYTLSPSEYQRLVAWLQALPVADSA